MINTSKWIQVSDRTPELYEDELYGAYSENVLFETQSGLITVGRLNHSNVDWFSSIEEEEIEEPVIAWKEIDTDERSILSKHDMLHERYRFLIDDINGLIDCTVIQCKPELEMLDKWGSFDELVSLAYEKHLKLFKINFRKIKST